MLRSVGDPQVAKDPGNALTHRGQGMMEKQMGNELETGLYRYMHIHIDREALGFYVWRTRNR